MLSQGYATPLVLNVRSSIYTQCILFFIYTGAIVLVLLLPYSGWIYNGWIKGLVILLVGTICFHQFSIHALLFSSRAITKLIWFSGNTWQLFTKEGGTLCAKLLPTTYVHPKIVVLNFKIEHCWFMRTVIICMDSTDANLFRQLRVRLGLMKYHTHSE